MALSKRGKVWWISYTANGKRVQKPIGMKKKAARYAELELVPILFEDLADKFFEPYPASPHRPRFPGSILTTPAKGKRKQPLNKKSESSGNHSRMCGPRSRTLAPERGSRISAFTICGTRQRVT